MKVAEIMTTDVFLTAPNRSIREAAETMHRMDVGSLPVGDGDRLVGMAAGRVVFDDVPAALTDAVARDLYGLEAGEVVGEAAPVHMPVGARPGFALAGS